MVIPDQRFFGPFRLAGALQVCDFLKTFKLKKKVYIRTVRIVISNILRLKILIHSVLKKSTPARRPERTQFFWKKRRNPQVP